VKWRRQRNGGENKKEMKDDNGAYRQSKKIEIAKREKASAENENEENGGVKAESEKFRSESENNNNGERKWRENSGGVAAAA
jgi:hypothetical protein